MGQSVACWVDHVLLPRAETLGGQAVALLEHVAAAASVEMRRLWHWAEALTVTVGRVWRTGWGEWAEERAAPAGWVVWAKEQAGWGEWVEAWAGWGRWRDMELAWQTPQGAQWWHAMAARVWRQGQRLGSWLVHTAVGQGCRAAALVSAWWLDAGQVEHVMCM